MRQRRNFGFTPYCLRNTANSFNQSQTVDEQMKMASNYIQHSIEKCSNHRLLAVPFWIVERARNSRAKKPKAGANERGRREGLGERREEGASPPVSSRFYSSHQSRCFFRLAVSRPLDCPERER